MFIYESFNQTFISRCWESHSYSNYSKDSFICPFPGREGKMPLPSGNANFLKKELSQLVGGERFSSSLLVSQR